MEDRPPITIIDNHDELRSSLERSLRSVNQPVVAKQPDRTRASESSKIFIEIPSNLEFLECVTSYFIRRIEQAWSLPAGSCPNLSIALSESLINAIKHGNKSDTAKLVRITSEVSNDEARFTVEDEGDGFDVKKVPHPRNPENLLKTSGRGVLFIQSIMDEAQYNVPGNRLTMVKRRASLFGDKPVKLTSGQ
ncbi:MAG TPA: ATP-binding protein [Pyrinomonadaceae bacterium]|nr:ATP-binding protein [Pyrinomonadaceae bacterium]